MLKIWHEKQFKKKASVKDPLKRSEYIAELVLEEEKSKSGGYDVVCMQEVFFGPSKKKMEEMLHPIFPHVLYSFGRHKLFVGVDSGLFVASKFPINSSSFVRFPELIGSDYFSWKGVHAVVLDISSIFSPISNPTLKPVSLVVGNTHLQSNPDGTPPWKLFHGDEKQLKVRSRQLRHSQEKLIFETLEKCAMEEQKKGFKVSVLMCGDFNTAAELPKSLVETEEKEGTFANSKEDNGEPLLPSVEYTQLLKELGSPSDIFRDLFPDTKEHPGNTGGAHKGNNESRRRIDFIFNYTQKIGKVEGLECLRPLEMRNWILRKEGMPELDVTDHEAICAVFSVEGKDKEEIFPLKSENKDKEETEAN